MTAIHWLSDINGSFTNASDWSGGRVPSASSDVILDAVGSAFTVTSGELEVVHSIQLASNATLALTAGTFTADAGTGRGANAGVILIGPGAALATTGMVGNTGTIALDGAVGFGGRASLALTGVTTLTGGGVVLLEGQGCNSIGRPYKQEPSFLYNFDNTIVGSGKIAAGLTVFNEQRGTIDANGASALIFYGGSSGGGIRRNAGLVEASGSGDLIFDKASMESDATGVVLAGAGSEVQFVQSYLAGGTLESVVTGTILMRYDTLAGQKGNPLVIDANVKMVAFCTLAQTIENNGLISLYGGNIGVAGAALTLEGSGDIDLGGHTFDGTDSALMLASGTISGPGYFYTDKREGLFHMTIGEEGVIDGHGKGSLIFDANIVIVNTGLIESTGAGGVFVKDAIVNSGTLSVQDGTLEVSGAVSGDGVAIIGGGTLSFLSAFDETVTFTGGTGTLELARSQNFTEAVKGFSNTGMTTLDLRDMSFVDAGEATFSGTASGGVLTVTGGTGTAEITLKGNYLGSTFVASRDGAGGTDVVAQNPNGPAAPVQAFVAAMAGFGAPGGHDIRVGAAGAATEVLLTSPRVAMA